MGLAGGQLAVAAHPAPPSSRARWLARASAWLYHVRPAIPAPAASVSIAGLQGAENSFGRGADIVELYHLRFERVDDAGLSTQVVQRIFQINNVAGARDLGVDDIWYDSSRNHFHLWRARIYHHDRLSGWGHDEGRSRPSGSGSQSRRLRFHGLRPGDIVNIIYALTPRHAAGWNMLQGNYLGDLFAFRTGYPTRRVRYVLQSPSPLAVSQSRLTPPIVGRTPRGLYSWEWQSGPLPAFYSESDGPSITDRSPFVQVSSFHSWHSLSVWYRAQLRARGRLQPGLRTRLLRLVPPRQSPAVILEKIRAILAGHLQYQGRETGPHAFFPSSPGVVWRDHSADCKDGALLLTTWLRLEGIPADLALLRTRRMGRLASGAATMAAFDHAIVYVPGRTFAAAPLWIDTTAPAFQGPTLPSSDQGALALILRPGQRRLVRVPLAPPRVNLTSRRFRLRPDPNGGYQLRARVRVSGADAPGWRARCAVRPGRRARLQAWMREALPGVIIDRMQAHGLTPDAPVFRLRFVAWVPRLPRPLAVAWLQSHYASALAFTRVRHQRLKLSLRWRTRESWSLRLPRACPAYLSLPAIAENTSFGSLRVRLRCLRRHFLVEDSIAQTARAVPAAAYSRFRSFWRQVDTELRSPAWPVLTHLASDSHPAFPDLSGSGSR